LGEYKRFWSGYAVIFNLLPSTTQYSSVKKKESLEAKFEACVQ